MTAIRKKKKFPTAGEMCRWDTKTWYTGYVSFFWTPYDANTKQIWWLLDVLSDYDN